SARALAEDLRRFQAGEPIRARPVGPAERLWRWCRRNPAVSGLVAAVVVLFLAGFAGGFWQWRWAEGQRALVPQERDEGDRQRAEAEKNFQQARQAVDQYFPRLSEEKLFREPGFQPLRRKLLEDALRYYQGFLRQKAGDPGLRADLASVQ